MFTWYDDYLLVGFLFVWAGLGRVCSTVTRYDRLLSRAWRVVSIPSAHSLGIASRACSSFAQPGTGRFYGTDGIWSAQSDGLNVPWYVAIWCSPNWWTLLRCRYLFLFIGRACVPWGGHNDSVPFWRNGSTWELSPSIHWTHAISDYISRKYCASSTHKSNFHSSFPFFFSWFLLPVKMFPSYLKLPTSCLSVCLHSNRFLLKWDWFLSGKLVIMLEMNVNKTNK